MENQVVRRRVNILASHLGAHEDISATATRLFPMSCSNSLNSVCRRCDSSMHFARQCSGSQGYFMRQASNRQSCSNSLNSIGRRCDSSMHFARQSSSSQGYFMRQASNRQETSTQSSIPSKSASGANFDTHASVAPMFSKPAARQEHKLHNVGKIQCLPQMCNYHQPIPDFPTFARPSEQRRLASEFNGFEWLPKMNSAESGGNYVVTLELPGVNISDIRVEVNNKNLRVTGNRSDVWQKMVNCSTNSISAYHKREITEGPYQIAWPLPANVNKDNISAELVDGLLMITIPKLSEARWQLEKCNI